MTGTTKHTSISRISKYFWWKCTGSNALEQFTFRNLMMNVQRIASFTALCFLSTAFTVTPFKLDDSLTPFVIGFIPAAQSVLSVRMLPSGMTLYKLRDANGRPLHEWRNVNGLMATTSTNVLSLVRVNPLDGFRAKTFTSEIVSMNVFGYANGRTVLSTVDNYKFSTTTSTQLSSVIGNPLGYSLTRWFHINLLKVNNLASGELLEPLPRSGEGNQQPSQQYTAGRFRDYWSGSARLMTSQSARVSKFHTRHDIVRTFEKSREKFVNDTQEPKINFNGLHFNSATLMKSRYAPGTYISATGDPIAVTYIKQMTNGATIVYPTVSAETLFWLNASKPYANFYVSDDPEFGFGFTGFKPGQGNTKVAGQILFAGAVTFAPRYHKQLYGITG